MNGTAQAVVIGVSAGAVEALSALLPALPENFALPVIIVVHLPPDRKSVLAELFQSRCVRPVREAEDKEPIMPGTVYFAPADYHLQVESDRSFSLAADEQVLYSRPSIDVLFETAADAYGAGLVGVILTGANPDGARGLKAVMEADGIGIVQLPASAHAPAMPQAALDACPHALPLTLDQISHYLQKAAP
jgi:two-component system chemotaxis response regulator CheB